ncbi:MAG: sigma-70 family RNA polymerase sigma factor [Lachnospiraceae bacterium]|nr:sigma-70 family RNA polymerase sigma factor [Ruminococcus sp.]MCM1274414.1 sigma-70 family RNA polymerase sigma factor [Lachnospiraceae bacterium]
MTDEELTGYVKMFHGILYRLALGYVHNCENAEDICQSAFVKLLDYKGSFDAPENCKAWLIRVTVNLSKNLLRSRRSQTEELDENLPALEKDEFELLEVVRSLPPKYRAVIHLYYYEGYSVKEIADIIGASATSVTTRLSRARERLKDMLLRED